MTSVWLLVHWEGPRLPAIYTTAGVYADEEIAREDAKRAMREDETRHVHDELCFTVEEWSVRERVNQ